MTIRPYLAVPGKAGVEIRIVGMSDPILLSGYVLHVFQKKAKRKIVTPKKGTV